MAQPTDDLRQIHLEKAKAEFAALEAHGVVLQGNAFSSLLVVKGDLSAEERGGEGLLSGSDGTALRAAFSRLGYAPEDFACLSAWNASGQLLGSELARLAVCTLDPATIVLVDDVAAGLMREAYVEELARLEDLEDALLAEGRVVRVLGMRVLNVGNFAASLASDDAKQRSWRYLKAIPALNEPY